MLRADAERIPDARRLSANRTRTANHWGTIAAEVNVRGPAHHGCSARGCGPRRARRCRCRRSRPSASTTLLDERTIEQLVLGVSTSRLRGESTIPLQFVVCGAEARA